jgi:hypothetical protein
VSQIEDDYDELLPKYEDLREELRRAYQANHHWMLDYGKLYRQYEDALEEIRALTEEKAWSGRGRKKRGPGGAADQP